MGADTADAIAIFRSARIGNTLLRNADLPAVTRVQRVAQAAFEPLPHARWPASGTPVMAGRREQAVAVKF